MVNLGRSISQVLSYRTAVSVPGIGVFKKTHIPASYYAQEHVFLPPYDQIDLVDSDQDSFDILSYLKVRYQLDEQGARSILDQALSPVFDCLNQGKSIYLDGVGHLLYENQVLKFNALDFGSLSSGTIPERVIQQKEVSAVAYTAEELRSNEDKPSSSGWWGWVAASFMVGIAIGTIWMVKPEWLGFLQGGTVQDNRVEAASPIVEQQDEQYPKDADSVGVPSEGILSTTQTPAEDSLSVARGAALDPTQGLPERTFEIIVGTFNSAEEAAEYVQKLNIQGHNHVRVLATAPGSRKHKVSWGGYATWDDAQAVLKDVHQHVEKSAWIDKIVNK